MIAASAPKQQDKEPVERGDATVTSSSSTRTRPMIAGPGSSGQGRSRPSTVEPEPTSNTPSSVALTGQQRPTESGASARTAAPVMEPSADIRTRKQRLAADAQRGALADVSAASLLGGGGEAIVLVARNHGDTLTQRLAAWRTAIPTAAGRVSLLDLGSTDGTWRAGEDAKLSALQAQGGLMAPMAAVEAAVLNADAERVLVVDLDAAVTGLGRRLLAALAAGADVALPAGPAPGLLALSAKAVSAHPLSGLRNVDVWTQQHGLQLAVLGQSALPRPGAALVPRLAGWQPPTALRRVARSVWRAALRRLPLG